jgi:hypothetical protein
MADGRAAVFWEATDRSGSLVVPLMLHFRNGEMVEWHGGYDHVLVPLF